MTPRRMLCVKLCLRSGVKSILLGAGHAARCGCFTLTKKEKKSAAVFNPMMKYCV